MNSLYAVARKGQTDFRFVSIWEQRKTREVLIGGFRNLGDAVENVGNRIIASLTEMEKSLGVRLDTISFYQAEAAGEMQGFGRTISEMLDNIQRGKEPSF